MNDPHAKRPNRRYVTDIDLPQDYVPKRYRDSAQQIERDDLPPDMFPTQRAPSPQETKTQREDALIRRLMEQIRKQNRYEY